MAKLTEKEKAIIPELVNTAKKLSDEHKVALLKFGKEMVFIEELKNG